jgi:hypothetical protein
MKYRVQEVFDTQCVPWFRLEKSLDGDKWDYLASGSNKTILVDTMQRIAAGAPPVTVAEIES